MTQLPLFPVEQIVVMRVRPDGRIEARWPALDLCTTFHDWDWALHQVAAVCAWLDEPFTLRIRR